MNDTSKITDRSLWQRLRQLPTYLKENKKKLFWYWVTYQCIKGALTTSLIWVPLLYVWLDK